MRRSVMRMAVCVMICSLVLVGGCLELTSPQQRRERAKESPHLGDVDARSFTDVFKASQKIDKKYGTNFHDEAIGKFVVDIRDIDAMVADLDLLITHVDASVDPTSFDPDVIVNISVGERSEKDLALLFLFARRRMLQSEKEFQLAYQYGYSGLVTGEFYCNKAPIIRESFGHFHASVVHGLNANYYMDTVLTEKPDLTWPLIGVRENRPEFYLSPLRDMAAQLAKNRRVLDAACGDQSRKKPAKVVVENLDIRS